MSYLVGKLLTSGSQWALSHPARYLSKTKKSLYFDDANIKQYTVLSDAREVGSLVNPHLHPTSVTFK